jgi:peptide/nickel transport system permease protein
MLRALVWRLAGALPVMLLVSLAIFAILHFAPGDAATLLLPDDISEEEVAKVRALWGLDQPLTTQYWRFLGNIVTLDFGTSYRYHESIFSLIAQRLPATLELALIALALAACFGVPLGATAALHKGRAADAAVSVGAIAGVSAPTFWMGIMLVLFFSAELRWLPSGGRLPFDAGLPVVTGFHFIDALIARRFDLIPVIASHAILPAATLALNMTGIIARITRSAVIHAAQEEFVFTATAIGLTRKQIIRRHLLPNSLIQIITIIGLELGALISGSIIVEIVFSWPGLGTLLYQGISVRDIPLTTGVITVYTFLFIIVNIAIDFAYFAIDPRVRAQSAA